MLGSIIWFILCKQRVIFFVALIIMSLNCRWNTSLDDENVENVYF
jgi:hypothetical protein